MRGRVIDTLKSVYDKSQFRVKQNGKLCLVINNYSGVNQRGIPSGVLFLKYMADGWPGDYSRGLFNGLYNFCLNNQMMVNETETKITGFGKTVKPELYFNNKEIEPLEQYE